MVMIVLTAASAFAADTVEVTATETAGTIESLSVMLQNSQVAADTIWVLLAAFLVFLMNLGFGMVETGLQPAKNSVNVSAKNFIVLAISSIAFWFIGWGLMFGDGNGFMGYRGVWMLGGADNSPASGDAYRGVYSAMNWTGVPLFAKFFFQMVFCATAATIVSGAVGGRIKFISFILFSFLLTGIIYPIAGHWVWGGGMACRAWILGCCGITRGAFHRGWGSPCRSSCPWPATG